MKTDFSKLPREEIEARITAMLLGEMAADEAAELLEFVSRDAELQRLHDELKSTTSLVAASSTDEQPSLSQARREQLLASFKMVKPPELAEKTHAKIEWRNWAAMAAMVGLLLGGAAFVLGIPGSFIKARTTAQAFPARGRLSEKAAEEFHEHENDVDEVRRNAANGPVGTKIELPTGGASDRPAKGNNENWNFQAGQRGFGDGVGGRIIHADTAARGLEPADAEEKVESLGIPAEKPAAGKDLTLLYGAIVPTAQPQANDDFFDSSAVTDAKSQTPIADDSSIAPLTGLPAAPAAGEPRFSKSKSDGLESAQMGGVGGGSGMSMQYYMSNPELMKRYFPHMYSMMQQQQQGGGETTSSAGLPAAPGLASADEGVLLKKSDNKPAPAAPAMVGGRYDRYRAPLQQPAKPLEENQVALGTELDLIRDTEGAERRKEVDDLSRKSELATVNAGNTVILTDKVVGVNEFKQKEERLPELQAKIEQRSFGRKLAEVDKLGKEVAERESLGRDVAAKRPAAPVAIPQPEVPTVENAFSTFSLNVSDVSFKLAAASLEKGLMPEAATVRSEEFINAFDYHDPEPQGAPIGFVWERARYPFAQDRDLLRLSVKTAASGRRAGKPLNLVLLLDNSGSMERADRVRILNECLKTLAAQLRPEDRISVVAFARTARLWVDGLPGSQASELPQRVGNLNPEGGTNLEEAMKVAYETARKHFAVSGVNRVVLLTDGAANLGDVEPESLKRKVETERTKGIALDCFGIGWEGLNDELLEALSRNGDGRYGFVNTPEAAASEFAGQLAGALHVAASDVKVQVEWNPKRVTTYRQIGYAKHQLTKEQFRDNTVDAAEIGAAEAGNALYTVQVNPAGEGPLGTVRVRFKVPGTNDYREHAWPLNYDGASRPLENSSYPLRLAGTASAFSEWLVSSPYATEVTTDRLLSILSGVPEHFAPDPRPKKLEWMIRQAKSLAGK